MVVPSTVALREQIEKFLRGSRCVMCGQPPIDELMRSWLDGFLSQDPAAGEKIETAIKFSIAYVAAADARGPMSGPKRDARNCYARRAQILELIARESTAWESLEDSSTR